MQKYVKLFFSLLIPLYMLLAAGTASDWHFIDNIDLIFHEAGHTIFFFMPTLFVVMAGSGVQVLIPLILAFHFYYRNEYVSSAIILSWAGQSMINVSVYAKDSVVMLLPLLGGDSVSHDWHYIMSTLHILKYTPQVWITIYVLGIITIISSIFLVIYYSIKPKVEIIPFIDLNRDDSKLDPLQKNQF